MRRLILTLALVAWAADAGAQITLVSGQTATSTSGTMWVTGSLDETLNFPGSVTSGNTVVAWTSFGRSTRTMSCTHDGGAMTAINVKGAGASDGDPIVLMFARVATTTGTGVTCTISATDDNLTQVFAIAEFTGMAGTLSTQGGAGVNTTTAAETSAATTHDSGADLTPDTAHNLQVSALLCTGNGGTWTDDGHTMLVSGSPYRVGYRIQSAATAQDWVPTSTNNVTCEVVTQILDGAAGGGGGSSSAKNCLMMGVCE